MTVKRYILFIAIAGMIFSCSKKEETTLKGSEIRFETNLLSKSITKGTPITQTNATSMGVYSYFTGVDTWATVGDTTEANWMDNIPVRRNVGGSLWTTEIQPYWPEYTDAVQNKLTFFAYAPYAAEGSGITVPQTGIPGTHIKGIPELQFEILDDIGNQSDLLLADPAKDRTSAINGGIVHFDFNHMLSKIGFSAYCLTPSTTIQSITLTNIEYKGSIKVDGSKKWTIEPLTHPITIELSGRPLSSDPKNKTNLSEPGNFLFLFPKDYTKSAGSSRLTVDYTAKGVRISKSVDITENWEMGKSIHYELNLGGSATEEIIIEKVTITPWEVTGTEDIETT